MNEIYGNKITESGSLELSRWISRPLSRKWWTTRPTYEKISLWKSIFEWGKSKTVQQTTSATRLFLKRFKVDPKVAYVPSYFIPKFEHHIQWIWHNFIWKHFLDSFLYFRFKDWSWKLRHLSPLCSASQPGIRQLDNGFSLGSSST